MDAVTKEILMQADGQMADICMQRSNRAGDTDSGDEVLVEAATVICNYLHHLMKSGMERFF